MQPGPLDDPLAFHFLVVTTRFPPLIAQAMVDVDVPDALRCAASACTYPPAQLSLRASADAIECAAGAPAPVHPED